MTKVGPQAPNLSALVERWIQSLKHGALNHFIVFVLGHFDHIVSEYVAYYLQCRPHQGIGNQLIGEAAPATHVELTSLDEIRCERRLGGLLKHYLRAARWLGRVHTLSKSDANGQRVRHLGSRPKIIYQPDLQMDHIDGQVDL